MPDRFVIASWDDRRRPLELIESTSAERGADFIVFGSRADPSTLALIERAISEQPQAQVIVVCDPNDPARQSSLRGELPPLLSLLAASPTGDPAVAVSSKALCEQATLAPDGTGLQGLTMRVAISGNVLFVESDSSTASPPRLWPSLTMPAAGLKATRLRDFIVSLSLPTLRPNSPDTIALRAGLLLLNDFFDDSHSCSQSMEGHQNADYWHAILHRREPDFGNAKYWFRHVGRHAIFGELAQSVSTMFSHAAGSLAGKLERWQPRLIAVGGWEPFAFVDLCEAAETDPELRAWCEEVQFAEMLLLLASTYRNAVD
ncbi:MAG: hypothetical protein AABP62_24720 [Planctomycetota bacterium]